MAIEMVSFPIQDDVPWLCNKLPEGNPQKFPLNPMKPPFSYGFPMVLPFRVCGFLYNIFSVANIWLRAARGRCSLKASNTGVAGSPSGWWLTYPSEKYESYLG